jgi:hypothetical protein
MTDGWVLIRLLIENAIGYLPSKPYKVTTPTQWSYEGSLVDADVCSSLFFLVVMMMELIKFD